METEDTTSVAQRFPQITATRYHRYRQLHSGERGKHVRQRGLELLTEACQFEWTPLPKTPHPTLL